MPAVLKAEGYNYLKTAIRGAHIIIYTEKNGEKINRSRLIKLKGDKIRLIPDNHSAHTSKETQRYLSISPGHFEFIFTPKYGSWLNLIENFFGKITKQFLRGLRVNSKEELINRIYTYIDEVNALPVVYRWKYKMDEIAL